MKKCHFIYLKAVIGTVSEASEVNSSRDLMAGSLITDSPEPVKHTHKIKKIYALHLQLLPLVILI